MPAGSGHDQITISGTPGTDENHNLPAEFAEKACQARENIKTIPTGPAARSATLSPSTGPDRVEGIKTYVAVRSQMIAHGPTFMLLAVSALVWPSIHVEIR